MDKPDNKTKTTCVECGDSFYLHRYEGGSKPPFPKNWWLDAVHAHDEVEAVWVAALYYREPGGRFPVVAKNVRLEQKEQRKRVISKRRAETAAKPGTKNRSN